MSLCPTSRGSRMASRVQGSRGWLHILGGPRFPFASLAVTPGFQQKKLKKLGRSPPEGLWKLSVAEEHTAPPSELPVPSAVLKWFVVSFLKLPHEQN